MNKPQNQSYEAIQTTLENILKSPSKVTVNHQGDELIISNGTEHLRITKDMLNQQVDKGNALIALILKMCHRRIYDNDSQEKEKAILTQALLEPLISLMGTKIESTFLHDAVIFHPYNIELTRLFLRHHAPVNSTDSEEKTPLHHTARYPLDDNYKLAELLLQNGAEVNRTDNKGNTALHIAASNFHHLAIDAGITTFAELLLSNGASVNIPNKDGNTTLHLAVMDNNVELLKLLLKHEANLSLRNKAGQSALDLAVLYSNEKTEEAKSLKNGGQVVVGNEGTTQSQRKPTVFKAMFQDENLQKAYIETHSLPAGTKLDFISVNYINIDVAKLLLEKITDVNTLRTALDLAENPAMITLLSAKLPENQLDKSMVENLFTILESTTKVTLHQYNDGINLSNESEQFMVTEDMLNKCDNEGSTLLTLMINHYTKISNDYSENLRLEQITEAEKELTHLHLSNYRKTIISLISFSVKHRINAENNNELLQFVLSQDSLELIKLLIANGADVNTTDINGTTALHVAAFNDDAEFIKILLEKGATVDAIDNEGYTALMFSAVKGDIAAAKLLLDHGANVNLQRQSDRRTALHYATFDTKEPSKFAMFRLLVDHGADLTIKNFDEKTALEAGSDSLDFEITRIKVSDLQWKAYPPVRDMDIWNFATSFPNSGLDLYFGELTQHPETKRTVLNLAIYSSMLPAGEKKAALEAFIISLAGKSLVEANDLIKTALQNDMLIKNTGLGFYKFFQSAPNHIYNEEKKNVFGKPRLARSTTETLLIELSNALKSSIERVESIADLHHEESTGLST